MAKKKAEPYKQEFDWATTICAPLGCTVERSAAMFELAKVKGEGVSLVLYPHRTSAGHYHIRVRNNGSKNAAAAECVMAALDSGQGLPEDVRWKVSHSTTFTRHYRSH